uniref:CULLIN_2 domain-containing protein n=1 Tax=Rhabditophanes sp. KR3021 TaxID=114890 RepID=A0AC35TLX0_9BILA
MDFYREAPAKREMATSFARLLLDNFGQPLTAREFQTQFNLAYEVSITKENESLYLGLAQIFALHIEQNVKPKLMEARYDDFIKTLCQVFDDFKQKIKNMGCIYNHLVNRCNELREADGERSKLDTIDNFCVNQIANAIVNDDQIRSIVLNETLGTIEKERNGLPQEKTYMKKTLILLMDMSAGYQDNYRRIFEDIFIEDTVNYFNRLRDEWIGLSDVGRYFESVLALIAKEHNFATLYLRETTDRRIRQAVDDCFIEKESEFLFDESAGGVSILIEGKAIQILKEIRILFENHPDLLQRMVEAGKNFIKNNGLNLLTEFSTETDGVKTVIPVDMDNVHNLFTYCNDLARDVFGGDAEIKKSLLNEFGNALNECPKVSKYLNDYLTEIIKKKSKSDNAAEDSMKKLVHMLEHITDKVQFLKRYYEGVKMRIFSQTSPDADLEENILGELKKICAHEILEETTECIKQLRECMIIQKSYKDNIEDNGINFEVKCLTKVFAEAGTRFCMKCKLDSNNITIPQEIRDVRDNFIQFYSAKYAKKKIVFDMKLGTAEVKGTFVDRGGRKTSYTFILSSVNMLIMLQFNDVEEVSVRQLMDRTKISREGIQEGLNALGMLKNSRKVLVRVGSGDTFNDGDKFKVNEAFKNSSSKVRIFNALIKKENKAKEEIKIQADIEVERGAIIDCTLVQLMKSRQTLSHNELLTEATLIISRKFKPEVHSIKRCIGILIEKEFIRRSADNNSYEYIA